MFQKLIEFGLSDKEARVYLALLELGPSSVTDVARRARVTRTNAYHLLNSLLSYGLASSTEGEAKTFFSAEDPKRLVYFLKEKMDIAESRFKEAESVLPVLRSLHRDPKKPLHVKYYEGIEGLISIYEDTLNAKTEILGYASVEYQHSFFPGYFPEYYQRRTSQGIRVRCMLAETPDSLRIKGLDKKQLRTTKIIPKKYEVSPEINIYDDKVAIMSLKEKFGVIIESEAVTEAFRNLFEIAYEKAKDFDKDFMKRKGKK